MFIHDSVKHLCQMMARYRVFVFICFLFLSSVIKFDKKCANSTHHNRPTLEVDHCFCKVKNLLSKTRLFHCFGNSSYFNIHECHNFWPVLGLILLKLKQASNRPVYVRDLCAAYSALPQKSSPYHISTHVCKFVKLENYTT